jgi:hypothetical protein
MDRARCVEIIKRNTTLLVERKRDNDLQIVLELIAFISSWTSFPAAQAAPAIAALAMMVLEALVRLAVRRRQRHLQDLAYRRPQRPRCRPGQRRGVRPALDKSHPRQKG